MTSYRVCNSRMVNFSGNNSNPMGSFLQGVLKMHQSFFNNLRMIKGKIRNLLHIDPGCLVFYGKITVAFSDIDQGKIGCGNHTLDLVPVVSSSQSRSACLEIRSGLPKNRKGLEENILQTGQFIQGTGSSKIQILPCGYKVSGQFHGPGQLLHSHQYSPAGSAVP